jgi:hypothetical protein
LKDEYGRNISVKIDEEDMTLLRIVPIKIEEEIFDYQYEQHNDNRIPNGFVVYA